MTSAAVTRMSPDKLFKILLLLSAIFFLALGFTLLRLGNVAPVGVPLKPCKQCTTECPCPRLSGAVRCACPQ